MTVERAAIVRLFAPGALGGSIALLLAALLAAAALVGAALHHGRSAEEARRLALARAAENRDRQARALEGERALRQRIARYLEIVASGRTAPERRRDWVETLRRSGAARRLPTLDYEIAPQRPLDPQAAGTGGHEFLVSPMKLEISLLHENDLFGLLADLAEQSRPLVSVRRCRIGRLPADETVRANAATLKADCEIDWITLRERP